MVGKRGLLALQRDFQADIRIALIGEQVVDHGEIGSRLTRRGAVRSARRWR